MICEVIYVTFYFLRVSTEGLTNHLVKFLIYFVCPLLLKGFVRVVFVANTIIVLMTVHVNGKIHIQ